MLALVAGHEPAGRGDDPPPGPLAAAGCQQPPDGPGGAGEPGLLGHLAVGHDLARPQPAEDAPHSTLEAGHWLDAAPPGYDRAMSDASEPDLLEQATPVEPVEAPRTSPLTDDPEVPEADALEQAQVVPEPDDDGYQAG